MTTRLDPSLGGRIPPHPWRPITPNDGERIRCEDCNSEDRWSHMPAPRRIPVPRPEQPEGEATP